VLSSSALFTADSLPLSHQPP